VTDIAREYGITRIARLASNENPDPPSPIAIEQGIAALREANRYPDERVRVFVDALRQYHGEEYHFVTGVGMDGVIETLIRVLVEPGERVTVSTPTFSFYRLSALAQGAEVHCVIRDDDFSVDPDALVAGSRGAKVTFLCSPNNPTGNATPIEVVKEILSGIGGVLFLDNAYVDFADYDYRPLMKKYQNLIIGRTMSKIHSLAGLRIGYAFVPAWFEPYYIRASTPFTVNMISSAAAAGALGDRNHARIAVERVRRWRERMTREVKYPVLPSEANFVMVDVSPVSGDEMAERLAQKGVIVRSCESFPGLAPHYIRVSIGEDWENKMFIDAINQL
jgi:histidinol-phosphate aminotransferase